MDPVRAQYEAFPYPERDPRDERRRLIRGSPSDPAEIEHFLFGGARDWSRPFRALVAGGGTGDGLIMLAQLLADAGVAAEIHYLDMSAASRAVAEARARERGLDIAFHSGDLLEAAALGPFDYVDCCGVLHHLPDPQAGFDALAGALAEGGGLGAMVYAPLGRSGVYPMQSALKTLTGGMAPAEKLARAKKVLAALPPTHLLGRNAMVSDHKTSDAGLYDLLLHGRDRPFYADEAMAAVAAAGLRFHGFLRPALYEPATWLGADAPGDLPAPAAARLAEELSCALRAHVFYAGRNAPGPAKLSPGLRPRLRGPAPRQLAQAAQGGKALSIDVEGARLRLPLPRAAAPVLALLDGRRNLGEIAQALKLDWLGFAAIWAPVSKALTGQGLLLYSERFG